MNIRLVNKEIQFATHKITATKTFGRGEHERTIEKELLAFGEKQKDEIVADFEAKGFTVTVEEETPDPKLVQKAEGFKGYTLEHAKRYLTEFDEKAFLMAKVFELETKMLEAEVGE